MIALYLLTFIVLFYGYKLWKEVTRPELSQIPVVPTVKIIKGYLSNRPAAEIQRQVFLPHLEKKGIARWFDPIYFRWIVGVCRPDLIKEVLLRSDVYTKIDSKEFPMTKCELYYFDRGNILFSIKEEHQRHRRIANPAFQHAWPTTIFGDLMKELFQELDKDCAGGNARIDVLGLAQSFALDILGRVVFDYEFGGVRKQNNAIIDAYNSTMSALSDNRYKLFPLLEKVPGYERKDTYEKIDLLNDLFHKIIAKKRAELQNSKAADREKNLLTLMLEAEQNEPNPNCRLTSDELMNDLKFFFIAGHDTTATALTAAILYLGMYPEIQRKARDEVISILGDEKRDIIPTSEQTKEMKYINMIIQETLRVHPPASGMSPRVAEKDTKLGEFFIPKGTTITTNIFTLHHNKNVWPDPFKFDPERFRHEKEIQGSYKWIPFGGGNRLCIGMNLSLAEQRVVLSMLLRKYTWTIPDDTIHQKDGIKIKRAYLALSVPKEAYAHFTPRY